MKVVLITGMLASGKSIVLRFFQDLEYYCIDNLPPSLITDFVELAKKSDPPIDKVAFVVDVRVEGFFSDIGKAVTYLEEQTDFDILFIDAADEVLISRYKLNRRRHLMFENERIEQTIQKEREKLSELKNMADYTIDTSDMNEAECKRALTKIFSPANGEKRKMLVNIVSFGFKHGILKDADTVFDARFIPNPYYVDSLRPFSGQDKAVYEFVMKHRESREFLKRISSLMDYLLPFYVKEGKSQFVIAIGCSGGRHRSVAIAEALAKNIKGENYIVSIEHRDINKE